MTKIYRSGAIGALTDEYEKAITELKTVLFPLSDNAFNNITNSNAEEDFQSVRNIVLHVVRSGYVYANHVRKRFGNKFDSPDIAFKTLIESFEAIDGMFLYTVETFEDKWHLTDDDLMNTIIKTSWTTYDLEALIEHAIVHVLRHRLQIEKMLIAVNTNKQ